MSGQQSSLEDAAMTLLRDEILPDVLAASMVLRAAASMAQHSADERLAEACNETTVGLTLAAEQIRVLIAQGQATGRSQATEPDHIGLTSVAPLSRTAPTRPRPRARVTCVACNTILPPDVRACPECEGTVLRWRGQPEIKSVPLIRRAMRPPRHSHASSWRGGAAWGSIAAALIVLGVFGGARAYQQFDTRLGSIEAAQTTSAQALSKVSSTQNLALRPAAEPTPQPALPAAVPPSAAAPSGVTGTPNREAEYLAQIELLTRERDEARDKLVAAQQQVSLLRGQFAKADSELAHQQQQLAAQSERVSALTECLNATQVMVLFSRSTVPTGGDKALAATDACAR